MLLVSVTTMAEGKREVWEYWGGSCLCVYTVDRRAQVREKPPRGGSSRDGNGQQGGRDEIKQAKGRTPPLPSQLLHSQAAAHPQKPMGTEGLWLDQMDGTGEGRDEAGCDHPAPLSIPWAGTTRQGQQPRGPAWPGESRRRAQADFPSEFISGALCSSPQPLLCEFCSWVTVAMKGCCVMCPGDCCISGCWCGLCSCCENCTGCRAARLPATLLMTGTL